MVFIGLWLSRVFSFIMEKMGLKLNEQMDLWCKTPLLIPSFCKAQDYVPWSYNVNQEYRLCTLIYNSTMNTKFNLYHLEMLDPQIWYFKSCQKQIVDGTFFVTQIHKYFTTILIPMFPSDWHRMETLHDYWALQQETLYFLPSPLGNKCAYQHAQKKHSH